MAIKSDYISGTLTITQGSNLFSGTGTGWLSSGFKEGDTLIDITGATEYMGVIESITGETTGTLTKPWEGPSLNGVPYRMRYQPDGARSTAQARNLIEILGNGNITAFALLNGASNLLPMFTGPGAMTLITRQALVSGAAYDIQVATLAERAAYDGQDQGYAVLVSNIGDGRAAIYSKNSATSGDWSVPAYITGPVGPIVTISAGLTTTLDSGSYASVTVRPVTGGYELDFGIPRGPAGERGVDGVQGPKGDQGNGLEIDALGPLSDRDSYDNEAEGFIFFDTDNGVIYLRQGAPGNWAGPITFEGPPGDSGAIITTTTGVGNGTPGPYTLNAEPIDPESVWVSISGVQQYNYTITGASITFGISIPSTVQWQVKTSGPLPVGVIPDDSVGSSQIIASQGSAIVSKIGAQPNDPTLTAIVNATKNYPSRLGLNNAGVLEFIQMATLAESRAGTDDIKGMSPATTAGVVRQLTVRRQVFTSSGTYTPHANMVFVDFEGVGGGGGAGAVVGNTSFFMSSGGGGGGAYSKARAHRTEIGATVAITVGGGGVAGSSSVPSGIGGTTIVAGWLNAPGGEAGLPTLGSSSVAGGVSGGGAGSGNISFPGGDGGGGSAFPVSSSSQAFYTAFGGASVLSGSAVTRSGNANGTNGKNYGGGGSGAADAGTGNTRAGGAGAAGVVIITEYCWS